MSRRLSTALARLESFLSEAGASIVPAFRPGLNKDAVAAVLGEFNLEPTAEILTWFEWHDGAGSPGIPRRVAELAPGGEFLSLEQVCDEYRMTRAVEARLAEAPGTPFDAEQRWPSIWLPLLRLFGQGFVAVEVGKGGDLATPVHVVWHEADISERARVAWPSLASFVDTIVERFTAGTYWVDQDGIVQGETLDFPGGA